MNYSQNPDDPPVPVAVAVRIKKTPENHQHKSVIPNPKKEEITFVAPKEKFRFDHVLPESITQEDVFSKVLLPFSPCIFDGYDLFVITYGGKSTGKSYTLFGPDPDPLRSEADLGLLPRFLHHIFGKIKAPEFNEIQTAVKVSSCDVTHDDVSDLLSTGQRRKSLIGNRDVGIEPGTEIECNDVQEVLRCYESSMTVSRAKNVQNAVISHHFFKVIIEQRKGNLGIKSTVAFVDLAPSDSDNVQVGTSVGMHPSISGSHVNIGLLSLECIIRDVSHFYYETQMLPKLLKNAFKGKALTLILACISAKPEDAEETLRSLRFAQQANKIVNYPTANTSQVVRQFSDETEEIRYLNSSSTSNTSQQNNPKPPILPDLLHPNFMQSYLIQQQMLQHYMMIQQMQQDKQLQQQYSEQQPISSPFIPITSPMDLKSPLNVKMYLNENTLPMNLHQPPGGAPQQQASQFTLESVENEAAKPQPRERKSSLAAVQKTLDSILEESEHDSSTKRSTIESDSNREDEPEDTESEFSSEENDDIDDDEEFDSDCSEVSVEQLNTEEVLYQLAVDTDELIKKEQESILKEFLQSNSDLSQLTQNLERLNSEILHIDTLIQAKDKILEEAAQSSLELKQAKSQLETKLSELKQESSSIRQQLNKAQRKLNEAGGYNRRSCNHEQKSKVEELKSKLNKCRQSTDRIESSIKHISQDQSQFANRSSFLLTPTYDELVAERETMVFEIQQIKKQMELSQRQDQLKIDQLQDQLIKLSFKESKEDFPAYVEEEPLLRAAEKEEVNGDHHRSRIDSLRQEKEKFAPEKELLEHLRDKTERPPPNHDEQTCHLCHTLAERNVSQFGEDEQRRVVEIDTINEHFDDLIDHKNAQMTGHPVALPHVMNESEQEKYMSYVSNMSEAEAKHLLVAGTHRLIDVRLQGKQSDKEILYLDNNLKHYDKELRIKKYENLMIKVEYDTKFREELKREQGKYSRKITDLTLQHESQLERKDQEMQHKDEEIARLKKKLYNYKVWYDNCVRHHPQDHGISSTPSKTSASGRVRTPSDKKTDKRTNKSSKHTAVVFPNNSQAED